jgi:hypothetical protein
VTVAGAVNELFRAGSTPVDRLQHLEARHMNILPKYPLEVLLVTETVIAQRMNDLAAHL